MRAAGQSRNPIAGALHIIDTINIAALSGAGLFVVVSDGILLAVAETRSEAKTTTGLSRFLQHYEEVLAGFGERARATALTVQS